MSGSKQWEGNRSDFPLDSGIGRVYSESKYQELYKLFEDAIAKLGSDPLMDAHARMTIEEVSNIIENNKQWNRIRVRTELNSGNTLKTDIIYDGDEYYDPEAKNVSTVIGSKGKFKSYSRNYTIKDGEVRIKITATL